ncbi:CsbD-like protein [Rhizobium sp. PP-F2F-G36]|nr:CsbD-like protein [Rhizobium sp. PP-F2F-G36]
MDKNRIEGGAKEAKGTVKEAVSKLVGNERLEAEGKIDKADGKAQSTLGKAKDAIKGALK